jgi:hypothetical protein
MGKIRPSVVADYPRSREVRIKEDYVTDTLPEKPLTLSDADISSEASVSRRAAFGAFAKGLAGVGGVAAVVVMGMQEPAEARYYRVRDRCYRHWRDRNRYDRSRVRHCDRD